MFHLKKISQSSIYKNIFSLGIVQASNYLIPLLVWPLMAKQLGIDGFGTILIILAICTIAYIVTDFGFNLSATYKIANNAQDQQKVGQLLGDIFCIKLFLAFLSSLASCLYLYIQNDYDANLTTYISIILIIFAQSLHCTWFFQGIEKMAYIAKINVTSKLGYVALVFLALPLYPFINTVLLCFLSAQIFISGTYFVCIKKEGFIFRPPQRQSLIEELKFSTNFFISRLAVSAYTVANILLIGSIAGTAAAGLYGAAEKIYSAGANVSSVISQALYPQMARTRNLKFLYKIICICFIPFCLGSIIASQFASEIMVLLFGDEFQEGASLLQLFLILLNITFISITIGYPGFTAIQKVQWANYTVMIGAILHIIGLGVLYYLELITTHNVLMMVIFTEMAILLLRISLLYLLNKKSQIG